VKNDFVEKSIHQIIYPLSARVKIQEILF